MRVRLHKRILRSIRSYFREKILSNHGVGIVARTKNGLLVVDACDFSVSRQLLRDGSYDWEVVEWLRSLLNDQSLVVFVGCHIGSLLIPISQHVRRTIGFEADPTNFEFLKLNIVLNGIGNAEIHNQAIGEGRRWIQMARNRHNTGNTSVLTAGGLGEGSVEMTTLDAQLRDVRVDLIVMDIEGYELHAMKGAVETLSATKYFYVEYAPEQLTEFGTSRFDFVDHISGIYEHMYILADPLQCFYNKQWVPYLREMPQQRGLLMNLLFSNERLPQSR